MPNRRYEHPPRDGDAGTDYRACHGDDGVGRACYGDDGPGRPRRESHLSAHRSEGYRDRRDGRDGRRAGGVPDGLLLGLLGLILGLSVLTWTGTGLAGLLSHGAWPTGVTFPNTPVALRHLVTAPHDLTGAWPATPATQLSGYGLFWGLLIGQLLVLIVLTIFVMGVFTRWRLLRARTRETRRHTPADNSAARRPVGSRAALGAERVGTGRPPAEPLPSRPPTPRPPADTAPPTAPVPSNPASPTPTPPTPAPLYNRPTHRPTALHTILEAPGPALVLTSDPSLWEETKDSRAKLGPVLLYDPEHRCDTPARLHWSPTTGCEDPAVAAARAAALLAPVRPQARIDAAIAETAETLLRSWLHAAAIDGRPFKHLLRWAQGTGAHEAVRVLRTHPDAQSGAAGLLESALTAYPERREQAQQLTIRAFSALSSVHIREACTPNRTDSLTLESFADEGGTLYVVGEAIEDPRTRPTGPGAMPLLTALASHVVEHGRRMAARSSDGRLDPPMTLVLDDVAAVAPLPQLPELLTAGQGQGLPTLALLRSQEQFNSRWPQAR
ncbi:type IV secretory system conjugative DNA transfer family protein [Streptomyces sp. NPDC048442]|uniref:type IV secretory system conjugative DNA transfer family protein n=1 Tax=Streptomyces sp. NPDC048442 TaxID=3154823 RepID=UPI00343D6016